MGIADVKTVLKRQQIDHLNLSGQEQLNLLSGRNEISELPFTNTEENLMRQ
jgi:hypothetical protein